jgi:hypothetical protein
MRGAGRRLRSGRDAARGSASSRQLDGVSVDHGTGRRLDHGRSLR